MLLPAYLRRHGVSANGSSETEISLRRGQPELDIQQQLCSRLFYGFSCRPRYGYSFRFSSSISMKSLSRFARVSGFFANCNR